MEITEYRANAMQMIALTRCALNGTIPDEALISSLQTDHLFTVCQSHALTACVAYALESAGVSNAAFVEAKNKAIRKNLLLDAERAKILKRLEQEKIWYLPLKGAILKDWYPKIGMRQMSDNDILCDPDRRADIRQLMLDMGFSCEHFEKGNDDAYYKEPVFNFEMHHSLFSAAHSQKLYAYYGNIKQKLVKDEGNLYGFRFRDEDFYVYAIAHVYQHYVSCGTGVRSLFDTAVMLRKFNDNLDFSYISAQTDALGITEFENRLRRISLQIMQGDKLNAEDSEMLDFCITSGTYGNKNHETENLLREHQNSKGRYLWNRLFPPMDWVATYYPFFAKHRWLMPVLWIYRPIRGIFCHAKELKTELTHLRRL